MDRKNEQQELLERFLLETEKLTDEEKRAFLGETAVKFYGFENLTPMEKIDNML